MHNLEHRKYPCRDERPDHHLCSPAQRKPEERRSEELEEKVKKEFGGDKAEVEAKIKAQIADAEKKLADLEAIEPKTEKERLENDVKIATLKKGIYDAKEELKRVGSLLKADLVFFELTPVEFDIE